MTMRRVCGFYFQYCVKTIGQSVRLGWAFRDRIRAFVLACGACGVIHLWGKFIPLLSYRLPILIKNNNDDDKNEGPNVWKNFWTI